MPRPANSCMKRGRNHVVSFYTDKASIKKYQYYDIASIKKYNFEIEKLNGATCITSRIKDDYSVEKEKLA